jgi:membrane-associated phospholipid phosphatase
MARTLPLRRFAAFELAVWASIYPAYLAIRGSSIDDQKKAVAHATELVDLERATGLLREADVQRAFHPVADVFSAYYMLGFGPLIATVLIWLGICHRELYRRLRTLLLASLGLAVLGYVFFPTAPPRLVPGLGIADTVGLASHDTGSVAGIRFNPYAAMPSMHVGWSVLIGISGFRAARSRWLKACFALHPFVMVLTVTATGNHYFVDAIGGTAAALAAILLLFAVRRVGGRSFEAEFIPFPATGRGGLAMPQIRGRRRPRRLAA